MADAAAGRASNGRTSLLTTRQEHSILWALVFVVIIQFTLLAGIWLYMVWFAMQEMGKDLLHDHFAALIGLPLAGAIATVLVVFFSQTAGRIEFEALTIKVRGAAGPIVLWSVSFFTVALAIKLLW